MSPQGESQPEGSSRTGAEERQSRPAVRVCGNGTALLVADGGSAALAVALLAALLIDAALVAGMLALGLSLAAALLVFAGAAGAAIGLAAVCL